MKSETLPTARYNRIGKGYDSTRKADPYLCLRMYDLLSIENREAKYLDLGCGTGNYTSALYDKGMLFLGIDPSSEMLDKARQKNDKIEWKIGTAEHIDLDSDSIDGVLISLTIHHWQDLQLGFSEVSRILKPGGKFVLFTTLPSQTKAYWLNHYFPQMIEDSTKILPKYEAIKAAIKDTGLHIDIEEPYFVRPDLEDCFLYCGKYNPEVYFKEEIRRGISSFSLLALQDEIKEGLDSLRADIDSGKIDEVIQKYENDMGDYLFVVGSKIR